MCEGGWGTAVARPRGGSGLPRRRRRPGPRRTGEGKSGVVKGVKMVLGKGYRAGAVPPCHEVVTATRLTHRQLQDHPKTDDIYRALSHPPQHGRWVPSSQHLPSHQVPPDLPSPAPHHAVPPRLHTPETSPRYVRSNKPSNSDKIGYLCAPSTLLPS